MRKDPTHTRRDSKSTNSLPPLRRRWIYLELVEFKDLTISVVADGNNQAQHVALGNLPNVAYVVNKAGIVQYANNWLLADDIDATLAQLVTEDDSAQRVLPGTSIVLLDSSIWQLARGSDPIL